VLAPASAALPAPERRAIVPGTWPDGHPRPLHSSPLRSRWAQTRRDTQQNRAVYPGGAPAQSAPRKAM